MGTGIGPQNLGEPGGKEGHTECGHKKPEVEVIGIEISPFNKVSEELKEIREEPGMSNAGKYEKEGVTEYAGPNKSYPINDIDRGRSALKLAYKAGPKLEKQIKENVYKKYPSLEPDNKSKNA
tara:strand:- start:55 stop:423 length:369 start_codon:yes stop_codon:yes gene_type:complete